MTPAYAKAARPPQQVWTLLLRRTDGQPPEIRHGGTTREEALARAKAVLAHDARNVYSDAWVRQGWRF